MWQSQMASASSSLPGRLRAVLPTGDEGPAHDLVQAARAAAARAMGSRGSRTLRETRIPIRGVRMRTARAVTESAFTPHVTEFIAVDITETMQLRERIAARPEFRDVRLSPLVFVAQPLAGASSDSPRRRLPGTCSPRQAWTTRKIPRRSSDTCPAGAARDAPRTLGRTG
jgi:pyruvate/2-oxoglutarate dehydrogenase complex dihydrolipoamide acyltransferase (E2) component